VAPKTVIAAMTSAKVTTGWRRRTVKARPATAQHGYAIGSRPSSRKPRAVMATSTTAAATPTRASAHAGLR
jgi:hypothetical protein